MKPDELTAWRTTRGLSQGSLSKYLGVTRPCVTQWESGERKIPAFLHLALKCLKVKKGGVSKKKEGVEKKKRSKEKPGKGVKK